ncbi:MAG: hypothetical protein GY816_24270 [Cytophagales bacterium]|nr:hypothetical protein [Cytophagales bacterium]
MNCEDDFPEELPPITSTGENTFGALMNGEVYVPNGNLLKFAIDFDFPRQDNNYQFLINTIRSSNETKLDDARIRILQPNVKSIGVYEIFKASADYHLITYIHEERYDTSQFNACKQLVGELNVIQLDTINKIISGTFELNLTELDPPTEECLEITRGRFDLKE